MVVAAAALGLACGGDSAAPGADTVGTLRGNCASRDASLTLPTGFCAVVFADKIGGMSSWRRTATSSSRSKAAVP
jgi:hypothetical protein